VVDDDEEERGPITSKNEEVDIDNDLCLSIVTKDNIKWKIDITMINRNQNLGCFHNL